ncbi:MAG: dihydroneopterin aldolase [Methanomassiliicoccales archaeon]|nr:dihydroneopterin aldolase [Methanomassiliicoccales archaeon]NYT15170.1 dihydroneopterin aldolase [Methanomassiliicoccales archaeon]
MSRREELASKYFQCDIRERAAFEAGIKLGTIYHQFVGTPVASSNVASLEKAIEEGVMVQPFVEKVKVCIDRTQLREKKNKFDYQSLTGSMISVELTIKVDEVLVIAVMRYIEELNYPLMYIKEILD